MFSTYELGFIRSVATDGTTYTKDIQTNYTSRTDMLKFKLQQIKEALMYLLDERVGEDDVEIVLVEQVHERFLNLLELEL